MQSLNIVKRITMAASVTMTTLVLSAGAALADKTTTYIDRSYTTATPEVQSTTTTVESGAGYGGSSTTTSTTVASPTVVKEVDKPVIIKEKRKPHHLIHFLGVSVL